MLNSIDWDPQDASVLNAPLESYDQMRQTCPVSFSKRLGYSVFSHRMVIDIINDHVTFSNTASRHISVPNSMDPPEHKPYRQMIEPYFSAQRMAEFSPTCQRISQTLVDSVAKNRAVEIMQTLAYPFAAKIQCAFMGWEEDLVGPLLNWIYKKNAASLADDNELHTQLAQEFDRAIRFIIKRHCQYPNFAENDDTTSRLLREEINGAPLSTEYIVSILRNWTVGELGSIAASVGIIANFLADNPNIQQQLRTNPDQIYSATDEILRIQAPLISNQRTPTCPVKIHNKKIAPGEKIHINWAAANRDPDAFTQPTQFRFNRDPAANLLYGAGIHACPGAPLARLELEAITQALLNATHAILPCNDLEAIPAPYPVGGYRKVSVILQSY